MDKKWQTELYINGELNYLSKLNITQIKKIMEYIKKIEEEE